MGMGVRMAVGLQWSIGPCICGSLSVGSRGVVLHATWRSLSAGRGGGGWGVLRATWRCRREGWGLRDTARHLALLTKELVGAACHLALHARGSGGAACQLALLVWRLGDAVRHGNAACHLALLSWGLGDGACHLALPAHLPLPGWGHGSSGALVAGWGCLVLQKPLYVVAGLWSHFGDHYHDRQCWLMVPVWDDILTPLYTDPGVNIWYDILTPGSIYHNYILTPLTIFWPPSQYSI